MVVYVEEGSGFGVQGSGASADSLTPGTSGTRGSGFELERSAGDTAFSACAKAHPTGSTAQQSALSTQHSSLRAFTFGEHLGVGQSSITIEKTDLQVKGLAQFIFSEFCRVYWADRPLVNVGDDWGLQSLAWTKQSYRPVQMLNKYVLRRQAAVISGTGIELAPTPSKIAEVAQPAGEVGVVIRAARKSDLDAALELEKATFSCHAISKRQMNYLRQRESATFLVADENGRVVGDGIALVRQQGGRRTGRIYSMVVDQAARGRKIGRKLLDALLEDLRTRGVERVYLEVQKSNAAAIALYQRAGFRGIGVLPDYYGPGEDGLHMMFQAELISKPHLSRGVA
jgi:[ribosomal protein S18]-alanine N-acetyltransferase